MSIAGSPDNAAPAGPISADTLDRAVAQGVLTVQQVEMLRYLERTRTAAMPSAETKDDENFRFIGGFSDIFVTIGLGLFLGALNYLSGNFVGNAGSNIAVAVSSWLLAEYFTRKAHMALPSIVLLVVYTFSIFLAVAWAFNARGQIVAYGFGAHEGWPSFVAGLAAASAAALHYWRFRVPITIAAGTAALVASLVGLFFALAPDLAEKAVRPLLLACGIAVFGLAMRFDLRDPLRQTRRTDIAFWLHMLAAPLIVHPLVSGLMGDEDMGLASALSVLGIFAALTLVALVVDRRAILVSALSYAGFAFGSLVAKAGLTDSTVPFTLLVLGALVLLLSAGWHSLRRALLPLLPAALVRRPAPHT